MGYNVITDPTGNPVTDVDSWAENYGEQQIEVLHDQSMLTLATPDDSILVVGPSRLASKGAFHVIGMVNSLNYNETSQVQPIKAIGSKRHVFSKTNSPVSGSIGRMVILGPNLYRALYAMFETSDLDSRLKTSSQKFSLTSTATKGNWYTNLEEDLYRHPVGLGVIYRAPTLANQSDDVVVGAEYIENCVIVSRAVGMQSGSAMIMEQVSFMADRVVPWKPYKPTEFGEDNPANKKVTSV